jgi:hypothetical protein
VVAASKQFSEQYNSMGIGFDKEIRGSDEK